MYKHKVLILGKLPPPYMGPAMATQILLASGLWEQFELVHLDTRINTSLAHMGRFGISKPIRIIRLYLRMRKMIKEHRPDIVLIPISQTTPGFLKDAIFILIAARTGSKILVQLRGGNFRNWMNTASTLVRHFTKKTLKKADGAIVLGTNLKHLFNGYFQEEKIFVVPNGMNYPVNRGTGNTDKLSILYFANFFRSKGFDRVLKALSIMQSYGLTQHLDAVGEWSDKHYRRECETLIYRNNLDVSLHPPASGEVKASFFVKAGIFVFTPVGEEGHPWVIIEAMAAGLPIITTNRGAIKESVIDGENGFVLQDPDPEEIAHRIKQLFQDKEMRMNMGKNSRRRYLDHFTETNMVSAMSAVFNKVLSCAE